MELPNRCRRCTKFYFNVQQPCTCPEREEDLKKLAQQVELTIRIERAK